MTELRRLTLDEYDILLGRNLRTPPCKTHDERALRPSDRPNHDAGWHPAVCALCGADLDVDSSG